MDLEKYNRLLIEDQVDMDNDYHSYINSPYFKRKNVPVPTPDEFIANYEKLYPRYADYLNSPKGKQESANRWEEKLKNTIDNMAKAVDDLEIKLNIESIRNDPVLRREIMQQQFSSKIALHEFLLKSHLFHEYTFSRKYCPQNDNEDLSHQPYFKSINKPENCHHLTLLKVCADLFDITINDEFCGLNVVYLDEVKINGYKRMEGFRGDEYQPQCFCSNLYNEIKKYLHVSSNNNMKKVLPTQRIILPEHKFSDSQIRAKIWIYYEQLEAVVTGTRGYYWNKVEACPIAPQPVEFGVTLR